MIVKVSKKHEHSQSIQHRVDAKATVEITVHTVDHSQEELYHLQLSDAPLP